MPCGLFFQMPPDAPGKALLPVVTPPGRLLRATPCAPYRAFWSVSCLLLRRNTLSSDSVRSGKLQPEAGNPALVQAQFNMSKRQVREQTPSREVNSVCRLKAVIRGTLLGRLPVLTRRLFGAQCVTVEAPVRHRGFHPKKPPIRARVLGEFSHSWEPRGTRLDFCVGPLSTAFHGNVLPRAPLKSLPHSARKWLFATLPRHYRHPRNARQGRVTLRVSGKLQP